LDHSASATGVTIDLTSGTATSTGGIADIENILTGAGADTIIGALGATILDTGAGSDTLNFSNVAANLDITVHAGGALSVTDGIDAVNNIAGAENIIGGMGTNTYTFEDGAALVGTLSGGSNVLNYAAYTTGITVDLGAGTATGTAGATGVVGVVGGSGSDTLTGADGANAWSITGLQWH
jgi:Ca2+-binding RTX toxin-like protein